MAIPFNFRNSAKGYVEGGFDHPGYDIWSRWITPNGPQAYPLAWTILGVTAFCGICWFAVIDIAAHLMR